MNSQTRERVERWESRPFDGGLATLADRNFSGAVSADGAWLFVLNGRGVGAVGGDLETFDAGGRCHVAPDDALPLLAAMRSTDGETRGKYYTNETPLSEVDRTLTEGSFTGYVELSEGVLSGDYYLVYYGGRRMAAAYIGNAERLLTGEEAYERAADEVGIYEVFDVDVDVTDLGTVGGGSSPSADDGSVPEPDPEPGAGVGGAEPMSSAEDAEPMPGVEEAEPTADVEAEPMPGVEEAEPTAEDGSTAGDEPSADPVETVSYDEGTSTGRIEDGPMPGTENVEGGEEVTMPAELTDEDGPPSEGSVGADAPAEDESATDAGAQNDVEDSIEDGIDEGSAEGGVDDDSAEDGADESSIEGGVDEDSAEDAIDEKSAVEGSGGPSPTPEEVEAAADRLEESGIDWTTGGPDDPKATEDRPDDPETAGEGRTETNRRAGEDRTAGANGGEGRSELDRRLEEEERWRETRRIPSIDPENTASEATPSGRSTSRTDDRSTATGNGSPAVDAGGPREGASAERVEELTARLKTQRERLEDRDERVETLTEERDRLAAAHEELTEERDALRSRNRELSGTVERLQGRIAELEGELERLRSDGATGRRGDSGLTPTAALADTNLFVRYGSKSEPTLERAHAGEADADEVAANLRLEHHTGFDDASTTVDGRPYREFLPTTIEYRFIDWLTGTLLYEIRDTGKGNGLGDLYDAIPRIDRVGFDATISLADDDTEDVPDAVAFDLVAFDRMGRPLVVATLNDSRDPAPRDALAELEETASAVKANYPDLGAAFAVTSSFFEPGALEVAERATSGGLLSRGSKLSYVNLSRKQGYHLCLVESRSGGFHVTVPEL